MRKAGLASLGFFYCDFREDEKPARAPVVPPSPTLLSI